ncbi:uncharacterized protein [Parasteatoda tepidariorum]|uniref:uncharacterized protein n=1 Tax=Parasteatoda tepidariorum TaxID=114398 RepID=UPI001C727494|nr:uncharacterized protein LOC107440450 [Parasteatoda tepidariorum]
MDINSFDLEFYDFENASEEEIQEIHAILKGPGNNGSVELPWETTLKENCNESLPEKEDTLEKIDVKSTKCLGSVVGPALHFATPQSPLSPPVARLPPPTVEAFIAPPTSVSPYPNPPYIVSRTIPYLRAYHHMGMPFFACPIPGSAGEASPLPSPYGQFVPVVPATVAQEKYMGHIDSESNQKSSSSKPTEKQYNNRRSKKKLDYSTSSETVADVYREVTLDGTSPTVSSDRPPLVPLPVPPSTFGVAGGTIPLHGYPPGLHTLPYPQMTGPQAPSAAMYYVPVFNHPYSSYLPSPSAPMVLPVNLQPEDTTSPVSSSCENAEPALLAKTSEIVPHVQSNCEQQKQSSEEKATDSAAKNMSEGEDITDCNSSSDYPNSKSISSSPDYIPDPGIVTDDFYDKCAASTCEEDVKQADSSRCWADLFKKPRSEINGIDHQQRHTLDKDELYTNGKHYASSSDVH